MKSITLFFLSLTIFISSITSAKNYSLASREGATIYVVVIGAFLVKENAKKFAAQASKKYPTAEYEFNSNRRLYYVSILTTEDKPTAIDTVLKLRETTLYKDAWVYFESNGESISGDAPLSSSSQEEQAVTEQVPIETETEKVAEVIPEPTEQKSNAPKPIKFIFKLYKAVDNSQIEGSIDVINAENAKKIGTYKGNEEVQIPATVSTSKKLSLVCNVFGFRKAQREIELTGRLDNDISVDADHNIIVPFELIKIQKGDIAVMYNVYFFKDAAIMQPQSQFEVNSLLTMMKENPTAKILIHGHTNGSASGKILSMGDSKNFFSLSGNKAGFGTASELSKQRAETIKEYLITNGIEAERMEVKGWGGKRSLYDKESTRAKENVRVEIEMVED